MSLLALTDQKFLSFALSWQTIEIKARFIAQIMSGSITAREAEDIAGATLTYAEIKAIASGNPMVVEKVQIDTEIQMVSKLLAAWDHKRHQTRIDAAQAARDAAWSNDLAAKMRRDLAPGSGDAPFSIEIAGQSFS